MAYRDCRLEEAQACYPQLSSDDDESPFTRSERQNFVKIQDRASLFDDSERLLQEQIDAQWRAEQWPNHDTTLFIDAVTAESTNLLNSGKRRHQIFESAPESSDDTSESPTNKMGVQKPLPPHARTALNRNTLSKNNTFDQSKLYDDSGIDQRSNLPLDAPVPSQNNANSFSPRKRQKLNGTVRQKPITPQGKTVESPTRTLPDRAARLSASKNIAGLSPSRKRTAAQATAGFSSQATPKKARLDRSRKSETSAGDRSQSPPRRRGRPTKAESTRRRQKDADRKARKQSSAGKDQGSLLQARHPEDLGEKAQEEEAGDGPHRSIARASQQNGTQGEQDSEDVETNEAEEASSETTANEPQQDQDQNTGVRSQNSQSGGRGGKEGHDGNNLALGKAEEGGEDGDEDGDGNGDGDSNGDGNGDGDGDGDEDEDEDEDEERPEPIEELDSMEPGSLFGQVSQFQTMLMRLGEIGMAVKKHDRKDRRGELDDYKDGQVGKLCLRCKKTETAVRNLFADEVDNQDTEGNNQDEDRDEDVASKTTAFKEIIDDLVRSVEKFKITSANANDAWKPITGTYSHVYPAMCDVLIAALIFYDTYFGDHVGSKRWHDPNQHTALLALLAHIHAILHTLAPKLEAARDACPNFTQATAALPPFIQPVRSALACLTRATKPFIMHFAQQERKRAHADQQHRQRARDAAAAKALAATQERELEDAASRDVWRALRTARALAEPDPRKKARLAAAPEDSTGVDGVDDETDAERDDGAVYDEHGERGERVSMFGGASGGAQQQRSLKRQQRRVLWTEEQAVALAEALEAFPTAAPPQRGWQGPPKTWPFQYIFWRCCTYRGPRERRYPGPLQDKDAAEIVEQAAEYRAFQMQEAGESGEPVEAWVEAIPVIEWRKGL
ncbi:MAG: hypothetical protein M1822_008644 [Bathelium mastoideum]|nr:MAG: hypothetical protein M1822_008644 [Bathelium mastoideum]